MELLREPKTQLNPALKCFASRDKMYPEVKKIANDLTTELHNLLDKATNNSKDKAVEDRLNALLMLIGLKKDDDEVKIMHEQLNNHYETGAIAREYQNLSNAFGKNSLIINMAHELPISAKIELDSKKIAEDMKVDYKRSSLQEDKMYLVGKDGLEVETNLLKFLKSNKWFA